ncbi:alpha-L-arabinofuranosidase [candidate division KSB1 bacterium]|nr:alpha-L-arabinofuranosidase [candidate division KSB1 bacterium]
MKIIRIRKSLVILISLLTLTTLVYSAPQITVDVSKPGVQISPTMYGIFFEDINFGADGGLYAELVKNRSFEFDRPMRGWQELHLAGSSGRIFVLRDENRPRNPRFLRIRIEKTGDGFGLSNEGFRGIGIRDGASYRFHIDAGNVSGNISGLRIKLVGQDNRILAAGQIKNLGNDWQTYECELAANGTDPKAKLNIWIEGTGQLDIDMVSLFPKDTWKGRENGLRADLVQLLADMKPGFLRFPGGCIVEGFDLSQRYQWKNTIGDPGERVWNINRWNFEFKHRPTPDYYQSYGLGYYEFFLLAEDISAEPMPIITCGMACQFNTAELVPMDQLAPYVQDALDLIEFANGTADTKWGKIRADMGHPAPFNMKMIGIGNEQWGPQYIDRYKEFAKAIKAKYPDMKLIAATGSDATIFPNGQNEVDYLWSQWRILKPEIVDEHFYRSPKWFLENNNWYDNYERGASKVFVGEYASQSVGVASPDNSNSWKCALYEAAFMTGLERNADLVTMSCYAPLFGHEEAWQWRPNLIWFDNLSSYGSANYYVQKLFSLNAGTRLLAVNTKDIPNFNDKTKALHISSTLDETAGEVIIKAVNVNETAIKSDINLKGSSASGKTATAIVLSSPSLDAENSLAEPTKIFPVEQSIQIKGSAFSYEFPAHSLTILRVPVK